MSRKRFSILLFSLPLLFALPGCETIREIDRAAGEHARAMKAERARAQARARESRVLHGVQRTCRAASGVLLAPGVDPDTAYLRLKRYFGFNTWEEARVGYPYPELLKDTNYLHDTLPGVRYAMHEGITWPSAAYGPVHVWLNLDIEKAGGGSRISWNYCEGTDGWDRLGDPEAVKRNLRKEIARVVQGGRK